MASNRFRPLQLILYGLVIVAGYVLYARPDLLGRLAGRTETLDPCTSPLAWHIRSVDPRFGFTRDQVLRAVEAGARVWEGAAGRPLFRRDTDTTGMAIELVYDERQQASLEQQARAADVAELEAEVRRLEPLLARLERRATDAGDRYERVRTEANRRAYRSAIDRYNVAVDQYNRAVAAYNQAVDALRASDPGEVTAGDLRAERRTLGGRVMSVDRTLTIAVAGGYEELLVVMTHELGHALGLGHVPEPGAIMAETYRQQDVVLPVMLKPADVRALTELCR